MPDSAVPPPTSDERRGARRCVVPKCARCGFSLSGLEAQQVCPECAHSVVSSLRDLRFASDDLWVLAHLRRAAGEVAISGIAAVALGALVGLAALAPFAQSSQAGKAVFVVALILAIPIGVLHAWFFIVGWLNMTEARPGADSRGPSERWRRRSRRAWRWILLFIPIGIGGALLAELDRALETIVSAVGGALSVLLGAWLLVASLMYVSEICERLDLTRLRILMKRLARGFALAGVVAALASLIEPVVMPAHGAGASITASIVHGVRFASGAIFLALYGLSAALMLVFRSALGDCVSAVSSIARGTTDEQAIDRSTC